MLLGEDSLGGGTLKTLLQEVEAHVETLKSLKYEVVSLRHERHDSLKWTMQVVFGVRDQVVD